MHTNYARAMPASRSLVPLGARLVKVLVAALALVATFSALGYPVASLLAGLGIGGLAVALAAQKTVENPFGAFSIGKDRVGPGAGIRASGARKAASEFARRSRGSRSAACDSTSRVVRRTIPCANGCGNIVPRADVRPSDAVCGPSA